MNDDAPHSALRRLRRHMSSPATLAALASVSAVLTLVGPFDTDQSLPTGMRALYWTAMVAATYGIGAAIDTVLRPRLARRAGLVLLPPLMALAVTATVVGVNLGFFGRLPGGTGWRGDLATIFAIALIVILAMQTVAMSLARTNGAGAAPASDDAGPPILDRMPLDKRGPLVALSVEDHYVRIRTVRGEAMVLMRLTDAIRETTPVAGLRVHRSHWVARDAVRAVRREGDRAILSMAAGGDIPASRAHIPALKEAGLLPR